MSTVRYGFRIVGSCHERRQSVDPAAAFRAYATCDARCELEREAYLSAFQFDEDLRRQIDSTGSSANYNGSTWSRWLWFDIDRTSPDIALNDTRTLATQLVDSFDCELLLVFYSGSKGFHVGLPTKLWNPEPSINFHAYCRTFAEDIAESISIEIDRGVYDRVRPFRAPNSRHPKTGRYKRRLTLDELFAVTIDSIIELSKSPFPFEVSDDVSQNEAAVAAWHRAIATTDARIVSNGVRRCNGTMPNKLNWSTLDFIRNGASEGDRHRLLFSAAANLADFGCPIELATALLTESALDSGLSPSDVRRQIECGMRRGGGAK